MSDKIRDAYLTFASDLQAVGAQTEKKITHLFAKEAEVIAQQLATEHMNYTKFKISRLKQTLEWLEKSLGKTAKNAQTLIQNDLKEVAAAEVNMNTKAFDRAYGIQPAVPALTATYLTRLSNKTLVMGTPIDAHFNKLSANLKERVFASVRTSFVRGESLNEAVTRLRGSSVVSRYKDGVTAYTGGAMDLNRRQATTLMRTAIQAVSQGARADIYKRNTDVIRGVIAVTALDDRVSDICKALSGTVWVMKNGTFVPEIEGGIPYPGNPPFHFNCRTQLLPVVRSWQELSSPARRKIADKIHERGKSVAKTKSSMDGLVPQDMHYEEWFKTKSEAFQLKVLGPGKFKLWQQNNLSFKDMVNRSATPLTIAQLKEKYN